MNNDNSHDPLANNNATADAGNSPVPQPTQSFRPSGATPQPAPQHSHSSAPGRVAPAPQQHSNSNQNLASTTPSPATPPDHNAQSTDSGLHTDSDAAQSAQTRPKVSQFSPHIFRGPKQAEQNHTTHNNTATPVNTPTESDSSTPQGVVKVYSSSGLEYLFFTISLALMASGLLVLLSDLIAEWTSDVDYGSLYVNTSGGAGAATLVGAALVLYFWFRLRKAEKMDSSLVADASRKRGLQIGLKLSFLVDVFYLAYFVWLMLDKVLGGTAENFITSLLQALTGIIIVTSLFIWLRVVEKRGL